MTDGPRVSEKSIASGVANTIYKKTDKSIKERIGNIIFQKFVAFTRFAILRNCWNSWLCSGQKML